MPYQVSVAMTRKYSIVIRDDEAHNVDDANEVAAGRVARDEVKPVETTTKIEVEAR